MRMTWWQQILFLLILAAAFSACFILGDLIMYGRVKW